MNDTGPAMAYLLRRIARGRRLAIYSVRRDGQWVHTCIDRARTWSLTVELGRRVVECWVRREGAA